MIWIGRSWGYGRSFPVLKNTTTPDRLINENKVIKVLLIN